MLCSNPDCQRGTAGPQDDVRKSVNVGVAAHITAASPSGPRYDLNLTSEQRCAIENGIWLCQTCAKLIDNDCIRFTPALLRQWKQRAEESASSAIIAPKEIRDLRLRVSPTRKRWEQLAQFQLFNPGPRPILIAAWYVSWTHNGLPFVNESVATSRGWLPKRLDDQEPFDFTVPITHYPVEELRELGVVDGDGKRWGISREEINAFIGTAVAHRPPAPKEVEPPPKVDPSEISIAINRKPRSDGREDLEIVFQNNSSVPVPVRGAEIRWTYGVHRVPHRWPMF
jgi:hypothetical protein